MYSFTAFACGPLRSAVLAAAQRSCKSTLLAFPREALLHESSALVLPLLANKEAVSNVEI